MNTCKNRVRNPFEMNTYKYRGGGVLWLTATANRIRILSDRREPKNLTLYPILATRHSPLLARPRNMDQGAGCTPFPVPSFKI
jgi:hypothetical protein